MGKIRSSQTSFFEGFFQTSFIIPAFCLSLLIASIFLCDHAFASLLWSQTNGPFGGYVKSMAIAPSDPSTIYLGTEWSGVYASTDSGETWSIRNKGLIDLSIFVKDIAVNPYNSSEAYIATAGTGVAKTTDGGLNWEPVNNNLGAAAVYSVAMDPRNTDIVYAGTYNGLMKSDNGGTTWQLVGLPGIGIVSSVKVASADSYSIVYAGSQAGGGIWRSTDEAATWTNILTNEAIIAIGVSPSSPESWVYAGKEVAFDYFIKRTSDEGATWVDCPFDPPYNTGNAGYINSIAVDPVSPEVAYAATATIYITGRSIYKTTNGRSFKRLLPDPYDTSIFDIHIDPVDKTRLYACGTGRGFYVSTNEGASWTFANRGLNNVYLYSLLAVPSTEGTIIFAGTENLGLFRSLNSGESWEQMQLPIVGGITSHSIFSLGYSPVTPSVFAGGEYGLYRSRDYGGTWEYTAILHVNALDSDKVSPEVVYACTYSSGFLISTNEGNSWSNYDSGLPAGQILGMIATSFEGRGCLFSGPYGNGIYRRFTGDAAWAADNGGLTLPSYVFSFAPNYFTPEAVYAGFGFWLISKTLEASSWNYLSGYPAQIYNTGTLAADPDHPTIYVTNLDRSIWRADNFGTTKVRDEMGLETTHTGLYAKPLVIDKYSDPRIFYADVNARSAWKAVSFTETVPDAPSNVLGSALSRTSIKWTWIDNSQIEQGFRLYSAEGTLLVNNIPRNTVQTIEAGLKTNMGYMRYVTAFLGAAERASSLSPLVYTLANIPGTPEAKTIGITFVSFTWDAQGNPPYTNYDVWGSTPEAGSGLPIYWTSLGTVGTTEYTDSGLSYEAVYWYKVRAINGNGITTEFGSRNSFKTQPPVPSEDIYPPKITNVRFDTRAYFDNDIIFNVPRIYAVITDYASHEPDLPPNVTPEGVDPTSIKIRFGDYVFSVTSHESLTSTIEVINNFAVPGRLGAAAYVCTIEASDLAFPWFNKGIWTGVVRVMGDRVSVVGQPLSYPTPFRPLTDKSVTLSYTLSTNADIAIYMYDISGQIILTKKFRSGMQGGKAGYNQFTWNGITDFGRVPGNGIYFYKIISGKRAIGTGKLVVMD